MGQCATRRRKKCKQQKNEFFFYQTEIGNPTTKQAKNTNKATNRNNKHSIAMSFLPSTELTPASVPTCPRTDDGKVVFRVEWQKRIEERMAEADDIIMQPVPVPVPVPTPSSSPQDGDDDKENWTKCRVSMHKYTYFGILNCWLILPTAYCFWKSFRALPFPLDYRDMDAVSTAKWLVTVSMGLHLVSECLDIVRGLMYLHRTNYKIVQANAWKENGTMSVTFHGDFGEGLLPVEEDDESGSGDARQEYNVAEPTFSDIVEAVSNNGIAKECEGVVSRTMGTLITGCTRLGNLTSIAVLTMYAQHLTYLNSPFATAWVVWNGVAPCFGYSLSIASAFSRWWWSSSPSQQKEKQE